MRGLTASPSSAVRRAPFTGAVLKFLGGCRPAPNGPFGGTPLETARIEAATVSERLLRPDPERAARVRHVAKKRRIPFGYVWTAGGGPDVENAAALRARAASLGEALELEGLLPRGWGELDALRWRRGAGDSGDYTYGAAALPHEVAALAAWVPSVERLVPLHAELHAAVAAWARGVPAEFSLTVARPTAARNRHVPLWHLPDVEEHLPWDIDGALLFQRLAAEDALSQADMGPPTAEEFGKLVGREPNPSSYESVARETLRVAYLVRLAREIAPEFAGSPSPAEVLAGIWVGGVPLCSFRPREEPTYLLTPIEVTEPGR